ncbi:MerR family DNA-binding protein [Nocardia gipuzkoensis]
MDVLHQVKAPTLVIEGSHEPAEPGHGAIIAEQIPGARLMIVHQVAFIDVLKLAGFTLSEIADFLDPTGRTTSDWRDIASAKLRELDHRVQKIQRAQTALQHALDCRHDNLDDCPVHHRMPRAHAAALAAAAHDRNSAVTAPDPHEYG